MCVAKSSRAADYNRTVATKGLEEGSAFLPSGFTCQVGSRVMIIRISMLGTTWGASAPKGVGMSRILNKSSEGASSKPESISNVVFVGGRFSHDLPRISPI